MTLAFQCKTLGANLLNLSYNQFKTFTSNCSATFF